MILYRLSKTIRATDLTGEGAKRAGGRWNHVGTSVLYTAENGALAILEVLQYAEVTDIHRFPMLILEMPDHVEIEHIPLESLPTNWQHFPHLSATKDIGQYWVEQG